MSPVRLEPSKVFPFEINFYLESTGKVHNSSSLSKVVGSNLEGIQAQHNKKLLALIEEEQRAEAKRES